VSTDAKGHWENVCTTKAPEAVSWYRPHLETWLGLMERAANARTASIIEVGGASTLVDNLLLRGYQNIKVLDVSQTRSTPRSGPRSSATMSDQLAKIRDIAQDVYKTLRSVSLRTCTTAR
jgi:hypothetical protein